MNKVHRLLVASGLAATASLMANSAAFAGTTATVPLQGTVPSTLTITVTPTANASALPLTPGTVYSVPNTSLKIATITAASTNSPNGFKVTVTSSGQLVSGANSIALTGFGEGVGESATTIGPFGGFSAYIANPLQLAGRTAAGTAPDSSIFIGYTVPANQASGTYTGSITFTATDN